ncbi:MAG: aspartate kinase [Dehalococcoidales bacterium]|jgi:aspartate kinase|nr:aspartate kinase [Dehalococcoidales bacterium]MDP7109812.1 aspartate kinase [Dehalococcoidales bacterium]MDP7310397.1 aspartate kinase [Dehalococcoidales bacterium]MDP7410081.1 aspartate kinase [Dehalococcoidales bacterium]MDP7676298.1 aspartate kinase [Dehalococcoidales bacterium]|tara:strand:+ start:1731 stop:2951 length:1221 start_codon:yes stop_codon:yes gene_type:complete
MALIVQKYGGTSVSDAERIKNVAQHIIDRRNGGDQLVVVVSAMGDTTDKLIKLAYQVTEPPSEREFDALLSTGELVTSTLLTMALRHMGYEAISLSGAQAGIKTDANHSRARIVDIDPTRILRELEQGRIVIVAGFQGITDDMDVTTLGRGGSDTTAVALAASLKAAVCERYTDVEGIYTADPHWVIEARRLREIGYEEMLELAAYGSKVMHPRAIELAGEFNVPILVASSFTDSPGTLIHGEVSMEVRNKMRSIAHDLDVAKIMVVGVPDRPGIAAVIFGPLAEAGISVDTIVQNASIDNITDLTFTVTKSDLVKAMIVVEPIARSIGARECVSDARLGTISIIGTGMQNTPGYAARMFSTLSKLGINIQLITTSEIRLTCIIEESRVEDAVRALHQAFQLDLEG